MHTSRHQRSQCLFLLLSFTCVRVQLLFSVDPTVIGNQDVMMDDIALMNCAEGDIPPGSDQLSCDFERNTCGWYIDHSVSLTWERAKAQKPSYDSQRPGHDQTTGSGKTTSFILAQYILHSIYLLMFFNVRSYIAWFLLGYYMFVETKKNSNPSQTARLISYPQQAKCVSFWYHIYGASIGEWWLFGMTYKSTVPLVLYDLVDEC